MLKGISEHMPELYEALQRIRQSLGSDMYLQVLSEEFAKLESVPIEYGVMEHVRNAVMIPAPYTWSDVGSWDALYDILRKNDGTNSVVPDEECHVGYDTHGCLVSAGNKLVATIGLRDMIIVDSHQALMICPRDRAQDVKKLLELIKDRNRTDLL
jgi:mannose-1-phosphate guanylyltransferase